MKKSNELRSPTSCFNKASPDEPIFVLRAKDTVASQTVRHWATMAEGMHEPEKLQEARKLADEMDAWYAKNFPPPPEVAR